MQRAARFSRWLLTAGLGLGTLGLAACGEKTNQAYDPSWTGTRTISFHQTENGESLTVTYGRDGRYDSAAMDRVSNFFRDRHNGDVSPIDPHLLDLLVAVRSNMNLPESTVFEVTSGYRSPVTNAALARLSPNVAENSYHIKGRAVDFHIDGVSSQRIAEVAGGLGLGGYAWYPHTGHVHLDTGPVRTWTPRAPRRGGGWIEVKATSRRSSLAVAAVPAGKPGQHASHARPHGKPVAGKPGAKPNGKPVVKPGAAHHQIAVAAKPSAKPNAKPASAARSTKPAAGAKPGKVQVAQLPSKAKAH